MTHATDRASTAALGLIVAGATLLCASPGGLPAAAGLALMLCGAAINPSYGLFVVAATLPFYLYQKPLGSMAFSVPELALLTTLAGAAVQALWRRTREQSPSISEFATRLDGPIALLLAASLVSLLASEVLRVSLRDLRTLIVEPVAAYYLATWLLRREQIPWLLATLVAGGVAAAAVGLYQYFFTSHVVAVEGALRMLGPYLSPNQLGLYLGRSLPLALAAALFVPALRVPAVAAIIVLATALGLTFSVGAWIATLLAAATVVMLWKPRAVLVLAGGVVAACLAAVPILSVERLASHLDLSRGTSFIRLQVWEASLNMVRDHPILGVGMDNFLYHYRSGYMLAEAAAEPNLSHPHNLVLNFWLQVGVLGLAAFLWLAWNLVRTWGRLWRAAPESPVWARAALAGIAGVGVDFLAHGLVDNSYFLVDMAYHFWLLAGTLVVMERSIE